MCVRPAGLLLTRLLPLWLLPASVGLAAGGCGHSVHHSPAGGDNGGLGAGHGGSSAGQVAGASATTGGAGTGMSSGGAGGNGFAGGMTAGATSRAGSSAADGGAVAGTTGGNPAAGTSGEGGAEAGQPASSGAGGAVSMAGSGGAPAMQVSCSFQISGSLSDAIATVGLVDWSTDLDGLTAARIEFSLDDPEPDELNLGSGGPISATEPRALLLGMKPDRSYTYRIVATAGDRFCVSEDQKIRTRPDRDAPVLTRAAGDAFASRSNGFVVACTSSVAFISDWDGAVVWWSDVAAGCSRALLDWNGEYLLTVLGIAAPSDQGSVTQVRMDGSETKTIPGLERTHHDFAVLPGGISAFLVWDQDESSQVSELVERSPDGTLRTVATLDAATLRTSTNMLHANAVRYYARDDSYTVSDLDAQSISKLNRQGEVEWQMGACVPDAHCAAAQISGNHGHQLLANGNLLVFRASSGFSPITEYGFSTVSGTLTATPVWSYQSDLGSNHFGDVQRLPNGNTLVTYAWYYSPDATGPVVVPEGVIQEVSPAGTLVQSVTGGSLGYASFRKTLYGAPQDPLDP